MHSRTPTPRTEHSASAWYRQPVVWLGIVVFAASLAGCIWMIVLGARHADEPVSDAASSILKVPLSRDAPPAAPARDKP